MTAVFGLSGNTLKIIAAVSMLIDHAGILFFPEIKLFRIIGRLALPIFAFMIAEGCKYTKHKVRYLLTILSLAAACQIVYYIVDKSTYMCVLVTFSLAIVMIYALQHFKRVLFSKMASTAEKLLAVLPFLLTVAATYALNAALTIDYGFLGCMLPVFASLPQMPENAPEKIKRFDRIPVQACTMTICTLMLALDSGGVQPYSLLALPILLLYSGKRGKLKLKYFFYVFYPLHLAVLQGIAWII